MRVRFRRTIGFILLLSMILSTMPGLKLNAEAAVSSGINDMTALDALGIDISKAPLGYDPNTTENPFGKETTPIAVVDELFMVGRSSDSKNYSRLYGDDWAVGGSIDSFFSKQPAMVGNATNGINQVLTTDNWNDVLGANALAMTEANLDMTRSNGGRKDSVAYVSYKFYNPGNEPMSKFSIGLIDPVHNVDGSHTATCKVLISEWNLFGNNEDKSGSNQFKNEYLASTYLKIASGDFDGDDIDEIAVYVPSVDNPRIEIYKTTYDWKEYGYTYLDRTMIYQLDKYKATKAVSGAVPTVIGDTLIPNMVSLVSADFNMDGIDDLAISYGYTGSAMDSAPCKAVMLFGEKAGRFGSRTQDIPLSHNGTSIVRASFATGDIDGDGEKELVVGGSLASDNFNPNERYVAVYHWNGSSFSVSQSKRFNLFEKDNSGNYVNANVPSSKTEFYSLPAAPTNIAIGHFNGISEPVNIYVDSILIEFGDNGMEIVSLMDGRLRTSGYDYAEWGARAAQLIGDGTDTLITMTGDITRSVGQPTSKNFIQYYNEIIARLLSPSTEKTYMKAVYGADSGLKVWKNEVKGSGFCLPNTDKDSSSIRYTGEHYYTYIDPKILAVLASPPYFKDLFNDEVGGDIEPSGTSYGTTKGSGSGSSYSNTLSVGLYTSYEKSVSIFGVELFRYEAELEVNNHMTWETLNTSTVEQSVEYQTLSGQDTVVFFSMPVETYVYEQTYPVNDADGNFLRTETQSMTVNIPHEASVRNLPLEAYERIAADYDELPKVSGTVLKHTVGIPSTYPSSVQGYGSAGEEGLPTIVSQGDPAKIGYGASSQTKEIAMSSSTENSFNYELDISTKIGAGGGGLMVGITAGYAHGAGSVNINTSGSSYSGTLYALPSAAQAYGYDFNWRLFTYPYVNADQVFPVVNYLVSDITQPPMLPDNFVQLDQGTTQDQVALSWQYSGNPKGFTLYRYFRGAGSAGFYEVADISAGDMDYVTGTDGSTRTYRYIDTDLTPDTEYLYRIQTVGNSEPSLSIESETLTAYTKPEGIIPDVRISTEELIIYPDTEHTSLITLANADKLSGSTLYYQWQKYDAEARMWSDLVTLNTTSIRFTDAGLDDEGLYRCKVTSRQNTTIVSSYSPVLNVTYSKRTALMEGLQAVRNSDKGTLSVKLSGIGTKTIPSGTVVFKLEAEGYSKQYATTINSQGIATVDISTVPGVYKVSADYNGNRVFKSNGTDKDDDDNGVFYVYGQEVSGSYYWDYAENYTYGDTIKFTKYTMDDFGTITDTQNVDFSTVIDDGKGLWRKLGLYELPRFDDGGLRNDDGSYMSGKYERGNLYEAKEYGGDKPYCPVVCNESGACTHGVEDIFDDYSNTVIDRFKTSKAGWVGSYYIPYDLDDDGAITGYDAAYNDESFVYETAGENPEGFYFTVNKAPLSVDFKDEYRDLVRSISEMQIYEDKKVILTEGNHAAYGISEEYWAKFKDAESFNESERQGELVFDGESVTCKYSIAIEFDSDSNRQIVLTYHPLIPNGPGAQLAMNKNALTAKGQLFGDDPLETVAAEEITDTGLFDKGYKIYPSYGESYYPDECLFTYPVNLWAFEGHYFETVPDGNGAVSGYVLGQKDAEERPMDNYYTEHGLNVFRYDRFGARFPITKYMGEYPQTAGQFILGVEPTYYLNSYKSSDNYRLAYVRAHIAENYDITFGTVSMTVTGAAYNVSAVADDITGGSVQLVTPATGTSRKYPVGTQLIFVATPNEGFEVDYWEVNDVRKQEGGTQLKVTQIEGGVSVKVYFKTKINTLSYMTEPENAYVDGQLADNKIICSIPSGKELMAGAEINMSADAAQGYHFVKWEIHTEDLPTQYKEGANLKTAMPNANVRIYGVFERDSYTLTLGENLVAFSENKVIDASKPILGDTVITVKPAAGYELIGEWHVTEGVQDMDDVDGTFTFKLLKDTEISASINSGTFKVTINDVEGGEVNVSGSADLNEVKGGTVLKFTAVPERGYRVEKWIINSKDSGNSSNTYNLVVDSNVDLSVSFIEKNCRDVIVSVDDSSHAQLMYTIDNVDYTETYADGKIKLYEDETLIVMATPGTNSMIAGWSTDGSYSQSYASSYTVAYAADINNLKVFTQSMYNNKIEFATVYEGSESSSVAPSLTVTSDGGNIANGSLVGAGKKLTFTFSGEGVKVSRWTIAYNGDDETDILDENHMPVTDNVLEIPYTLNDVKIRAYYKLDSEFEELYTVTVIDGSGSGEYAEGATVSITADSAQEGQEFDKWTSEDVDFDDDSLSATTFTMPNRNVEVRATYKEISAEITSVTISPKSTSVAKGSTTTFSAIVAGTGSYDEGVTWSIGGNEDADTAINNGVLTVGAEETAITLTVTATSNEDSSVSDTATVTVTDMSVTSYTLTVNGGSGSGEYAEGATVSITADSAQEGQEFDKWTSEDVDFDDDSLSATTFTMPNRNVEVRATYKEISAEITSVTISPKSTSVAKGSTTTFSAIVAGTGSYDEGVTWSIGGNEDADTAINNGVLTVGAEETAITLTVTATSNEDSSVSDTATVTVTDMSVTSYTLTVNGGSGSGEYAEGATVSITADSAPEGQEFDKWTSDAGVGFDDKYSSTTTFTMPDKDVEITVIYKDLPTPIPEEYKVTLNGGGTGATGEGNYEAGDTVRIYAGKRSNYSFNGWTSSGGISFANANSTTTTFTMPDKPVTITANWSYNGGGSSGGGSSEGSSSEGSSSEGSTMTKNPTIPTADGLVKVEYSISSGLATLSINNTKANDIIAKAKNGEAVLDLQSVRNATAVSIPNNALSSFEKADLDIVVKLPEGNATIDNKALASILEQSKGTADMKFELKQISTNNLSAAQKESVKSGDLVFDINILMGTKNITEFDGTLIIDVPYDGELPVAVWYLNDKGELEKIEASYRNGVVSFTLSHLSLYVLRKDEVKDETETDAKWINPFVDVREDNWFYEAVKYAYENDLMKGTGINTFSPDGMTTRGMIVTILHRLEGTPIAGANPFTDVTADKYYANAVAWAAEKNIVSGYGNDKFGPEDAITREQMAVILMNYAEYKGYDVAARADLSKYEDSQDISSWAKEAMSWANAEGLIQGYGNNLISTGNATRAQAAAILYRFVEEITR